METKRLGDYILSNPSVKLKKGEQYQLTDIDSITIGQKYPVSKGLVVFEGQSASRFSKGDTIMARITPCLENGKIAMYNGEEDSIGSTELFVFRGKEGISTNEFVYYFFKQNWIRNYAANSMTGASGRQRADIKFIQKAKVEFPPLPTQQKIASILSAYDFQIENNQKRIKLLEQMAENLYKEWFVRFRFPGYETAEFKSSSLGTIPDTFSVENMGNVLDYYIGGGWGQDAQSEEYPQDAYVIRGADFPRVQSGDVTSCPYRYHKTSNYKARQLKPLDIILEVSGGTQEQPVGRTVIVTENLLNRLDNKVICASFCKQLRLDKSKVLPFYYYYWMKFMYDTRMIDKFQLQSTGIINFKFEYFLRKGLIAIPPMSLMKQFSDKIEPLFAEKDLLSEQISHLTTQRDLLLPRLMSGKLSI